ncbi:hypothetical protein [Streptomyces sp. NPDC015350]|uniref:hypothetical protein n=1 Tax=Streptomyces sp. NPDC015350 TaxID=3364955 RepID=UPI0037026355
MELKRVRRARTAFAAAVLGALALIATTAAQYATTAEPRSTGTQISATADGPAPGDIDWG